ncbi:MAG: phosphate ABC transporter substrate-binding protein [Desulforhabdus sp.]|jgi:phosphate transport system substrate-binding protein|nr:phosphate ABC transporter substrate-binding protein [Desulforhabdus sp.]
MKSKCMIVAAVLFSILLTSPAWAGSININGSTTVLPIAQKVSEAFMKEHSDVSISVSGGGSGNGIKALIDGTTDVADSSRFIKDKEVKAAVEKGEYPVPFAVAYDCIVPVVHPENPVNDIALEQLKDIYMGKIRNWKELGGPDLEIVVASRDTSSGTYEVWEEKVMNKERVYPGALLQASNGAVAQAVAKNKHAIGYVGFGYINQDLKGLTVNGVIGNEETTLSGNYPISRALFMFTRGWPEGDVLNFINYVLNPQKGQKYVREAGFVPLY